MKRFFPLILAMILALPSFGAHAETPVVDDLRLYAEELVALPDGYTSMTSVAIAPDGSVVAAAKTKDGAWVLLTWNDLSAVPAALPLAIEEGDISSIDIAPDGQVAALVSGLNALVQSVTGGGNASTGSGGNNNGAQNGGTQAQTPGSGANGGGMQFGNNMRSTVLWFAADGTVEATFTVSGMLSSAKALSGKQIAVYSYQSGLAVYDASGAEVMRPDVQDAQSFIATASSLYVVRTSEIVEIDLAGGQKLRSIPVESGYSTHAAITPDGTIYLMDSEGAYRISMDTGEKTRVMEMTGTLMGDPTLSVSAFGVRPDGAMIVFLTSGGGVNIGGGGRGQMAVSFGGSSSDNTLAVYTPLDASTQDRTEFTITALKSSNRLRKAVSDFQRQHPELHVNLQVQMEDNDDSPVADHIRTLNTDLLAGKGGDVIVLDGLPLDKYASKGILLDLTDLVPELDILPGIVTGSTSSNGKVYYLPAQFTFQTLWGRAYQIDEIQVLEDLLYANYELDQKPLTARTPENWLRLLYPASEASFRDTDGRLRFDTPEFAAFLEVLYQLYTEQDELATVNTQGGGGNRGGTRMNAQDLLSVYNGAVAFYPVTVNSLMQLSTAYAVTGGRESAYITMPAMDGAGRAYTPSLLVGVNANSAKKDMAVEFVRTVFSTDVQESDQMSGLPVVVSSLDKLFADSLERSTGGTQMFMIPGGVSMEITQPDEAAWDALRALCDAMDTPMTVDETLMDFMLTETEGFFAGRTSARDAAYALQQRAWFYLNE